MAGPPELETSLCSSMQFCASKIVCPGYRLLRITIWQGAETESADSHQQTCAYLRLVLYPYLDLDDADRL